jgi:hypothetical protein
MAGSDAAAVDASTADGWAEEAEAGVCDPSKKLCAGTCVAISAPAFGCGDSTCAPCYIPNGLAACNSGKCTVGSCDTGFRDCDGDVANGCEVNANTDPANCGACGHACPGLGLATADIQCVNPETQQCGMTCRGENYDVNSDPTDGCEQIHPTPPGHSQAQAASRGSWGCSDNSIDTFSGLLLSDSRVHSNPTVTSFDDVVGSAPDYWTVQPAGGLLCTDDYEIWFSTSGGGTTPCYQLSIVTSAKTQSITVSGNGSGSVSSGSGSYTDGTPIYFEIKKVCSLPIQEAVTYQVSYHL